MPISNALNTLHLTLDLARGAIVSRDEQLLTELSATMRTRIDELREALTRLSNAHSEVLYEKETLAEQVRNLENLLAGQAVQTNDLAGYLRVGGPTGGIVYLVDSDQASKICGNTECGLRAKGVRH